MTEIAQQNQNQQSQQPQSQNPTLIIIKKNISQSPILWSVVFILTFFIGLVILLVLNALVFSWFWWWLIFIPVSLILVVPAVHVSRNRLKDSNDLEADVVELNENEIIRSFTPASINEQHVNQEQKQSSSSDKAQLIDEGVQTSDEDVYLTVRSLNPNTLSNTQRSASNLFETTAQMNSEEVQEQKIDHEDKN